MEADDAPHDGQVTVREWFNYATERVPQIQLEKMRNYQGQRGLGLAIVEGEEGLPVEKRSLQRPRVFYRREMEKIPLVIAKVEAAQSKQ